VVCARTYTTDHIYATHVLVYVHGAALKKGKAEGETNMLEWTYVLYTALADNLPGIIT